MINIKKNFVLLLTTIGMAFIMAGCSEEAKVINNNTSNNANNTEANATEENSANNEANTTNANDTNDSVKYVFKYNGITMECDGDANAVVDSLGEPDSYFEEPSCAADGIGKYYTYADFEIDTYPDGDNDLIMYIILKTDNVKTPEGIDLSSTKDDVINAYGDNYSETAGGSISYSDGTTILTFIFNADGYVSSIQYSSAAV